jgi:serine protease Do
MDEKKNTSGFETPEEGRESQQEGQNPGAAQQETAGSGWVFSNKNAEKQQQEEPNSEAVFRHDANAQEGAGQTSQPNEEGWYRSGPQTAAPGAGQNAGYHSRYSYGPSQNPQDAPQGNPYENQQAGDPKASESYKWNYEDYQQGAPKQPAKNKKGKNKGLRVFTIIMCAILCAGVVSLAGYGVYALVSGQEPTQQETAEQPEGSAQQAQNNTQLTLNDKPASNGTSSTAVNLSEGELTITQRAEKVQPSVVGIVTYMQSSQSIFGGEQGQGSGIILSTDGYIVTNAHVVSGASSVKVVLYDGSEYNATIVGEDEKTDLAVLKIEADNLTPAEFGNSDQMEIGEQVIAIGNPGGLELAGSVTVGYVSALNRPISTSTGNTIDCIQTDAAINPGNSGGALVNTYGQVIGINSQKIAATEFEGIGFAISINEAQPIINDLIEHGYVTGRVKMGITMQMIDQMSAQIYGYQPGVGVVSVEENSPAAKAGLVPGDIITAIDGESVLSSGKLNQILEKHKPGDEITLTVFRQRSQSYGQDRELTMKLELGEAGAPANTSSTQQQQQQQQQQTPSNNNGSVWGRGN